MCKGRQYSRFHGTSRLREKRQCTDMEQVQGVSVRRQGDIGGLF